MSQTDTLQRRRPSWRPSLRGLAFIAAAAAVGLAVALYVRYGLIENTSVGLVCDAGALTTTCVVRRVFAGVFGYNGFGIAALIAALLALLRPNAVMVAAALAAGLLGVVLYDGGLAAPALSLLPFVLARPAPRPEFQPE
ncbi:MAG TPA: hypothetical protein VHD15_00140 [Hyphomicrobiales bacterium]|nr:hypothetical protein [Hyphomicrobiales bacterium]